MGQTRRIYFSLATLSVAGCSIAAFLQYDREESGNE